MFVTSANKFGCPPASDISDISESIVKSDAECIDHWLMSPILVPCFPENCDLSADEGR